MNLSAEETDSLLGVALADDLATEIRRYVVMEDEYRDTAALWVLHCWALDAFFTTGRLLITSPEPNCGKSVLLSVIAELVEHPMKSASLSPGYVYRKIEEQQMTFLLDEIDKGIASKRSKSDSEELLLAILNEGYRRKGEIGRCVGTKHTPTEFKVFAPVALAGISADLDGPFMTRTIRIPLQRHVSGERPERFRESQALDQKFAQLRARCETWVGMHRDALQAMDVSWEPPEWMSGRQAECWGPLLVIADRLGGEWPARADIAVKRAVLGHEPARTSASHEVLMAAQRVFDTHGEFVSCADFPDELNRLEESPCADWNKGKGITVRQVGLNLAKYDIRSTTDGTGKVRGYRKEQFLEAWERYSDPVIQDYYEQQTLTPPTSLSHLSVEGEVSLNGQQNGQGEVPTLLFADELSPTDGTVGPIDTSVDRQMPEASVPTEPTVGQTDETPPSDSWEHPNGHSTVGTDSAFEEPF